MSARRRSTEKPYGSYELYDLATKAGQADLADLLVPEVPKGNAAFSVLDHVFGPGGQAAPLAQTAVVESDYVDRDHARAHQAFFDRSFLDVPRKATRVHFFSTRFTKRSLRALVNHTDSYLGFCVVRPLRVRKIGRTVVPVAADLSEKAFVTTRVSTDINVAGVDLRANGPPFLEQDERVSRCATAALWMTTTAVADYVGLPRYTTADITAFGNRYLVEGRELPSSGLYPQQMAEALRAMGYEAVKLGVPTDTEDASSLIYHYVESGIPPLLILRLPGTAHVVTAVGHMWTDTLTQPPTCDRLWVREPALTFHRSSSWVPEFLAHDDETGPFVRVRLESTADELEREHGKDVAGRLLAEGGVPVTIEKTLRYSSGQIRYTGVLAQVLIPNPPGVVLTGPEAELKTARLIKVWYLAHHTTPPDNLVLRTYLARSNDFKRWATESGMHPKARQLYAGKGMPRWLWVTEISEAAWMNADDDEARLIRGEIVIDPTGSPWVPDFLAFHLIEPDIDPSAGLMATMVRIDSDAEDAMSVALELPGEVPYKHLGRHLGG